MQNIAILGVIAILLIGGVLYFNSSNEGATTMSVTPTSTNITPESAAMPSEMNTNPQPDIVGTAVNTPVLSTLVAAVTAADLVTTLQGPGPFTVFAPTNDAFAALPAGTLDTLLVPANKAQLQGILTYHVVPGAVMASDLTNGMVVKTVNGESLTIGVTPAGVTINGATMVTGADIVTSNGVVHVIDGVLLPPAAE